MVLMNYETVIAAVFHAFVWTTMNWFPGFLQPPGNIRISFDEHS